MGSATLPGNLAGNRREDRQLAECRSRGKGSGVAEFVAKAAVAKGRREMLGVAVASERDAHDEHDVEENESSAATDAGCRPSSFNSN